MNIKNSEHENALQTQQTTFISTDTMIKPDPNSVCTVVQQVLDRTDAMDKDFWYLPTEIFNTLHKCLKNSQLH